MRIIMTVRRVEDAMASWFDAFDAVPEAVALGFMYHWIGLFQQLRTTALIVPYEQIDRRPLVAVWRIARAICRSSDWRQSAQRSMQLSRRPVCRRSNEVAPATDPST
jgi:hypothetical protein